MLRNIPRWFRPVPRFSISPRKGLSVRLVHDTTLTKMSAQRDFHITVFGATGFTGKYVAEELHRLKQEKDHEHLRWAMAGRTLEKLKEAAKG